ncbi:MAG TPA: L,D-transpeptidase family protein [Ktedonobacterales bacterium]
MDSSDLSSETPPPRPQLPSGEAPNRSASTRPRRPLRTALLIALLVCVALIGAGSVFISSLTATPTGGHVTALPVVTLYKPSTAKPANSGPAPKPGPCNCTSGQFVIPRAPTNVPSSGQYIVVSETDQWLWAYQNGTPIFNTPVVTGRPGLDTPTGIFSVMEKDYGITMISPWPQGSPYYYLPTYIDYAMLFDTGGYFLHDAWWRSDFGPGNNVPHIGPTGEYETGSHGCVQMPKPAAYWLITWVNVGTPVRVDG